MAAATILNFTIWRLIDSSLAQQSLFGIYRHNLVVFAQFVSKLLPTFEMVAFAIFFAQI
jgi:hypothetical protein